MSVCVCLYTVYMCVLSVREHIDLRVRHYVRPSLNVLCMAVARSSSGGLANAMRYVFQFSWMTSYLHIMNWPYGACRCHCSEWRHYVVVRSRLTPLLRRIGCVVSWTTEGAETRRAHRAKSAGRWIFLYKYITSTNTFATVVHLDHGLSKSNL